MKKKNLKSSILMVSLLCLNFVAYGQIVHVTTQEESKPCKCYCAFKGDYRDKTPKDRPFIDEENGEICFCAPRDKVKYEYDKMNNPREVVELPLNPSEGQTCCS